MLVPKWGRGTHCAAFGRFVQTTTAGQMLMRAAHAHLGTALLSTKPGAPPETAPALFRPAGGLPRLQWVVGHHGVTGTICTTALNATPLACHSPKPCHATSGAIRDEAEAGGATSGAARRAGRGGLPLAPRGVGEDCLSPKGEFRSRPPWPSTERSPPLRGGPPP